MASLAGIRTSLETFHTKRHLRAKIDQENQSEPKTCLCEPPYMNLWSPLCFVVLLDRSSGPYNLILAKPPKLQNPSKNEDVGMVCHACKIEDGQLLSNQNLSFLWRCWCWALRELFSRYRQYQVLTHEFASADSWSVNKH